MIKLTFLIIIFINALYAKIDAIVDKNHIEEGEIVTYSINIIADNIKKPNLQTLCDTNILSKSSGTNISMINGTTSKSYTLNYRFIPQKSCKIDAMAVEVDGKIEYSNPIDIEVLKSQDIKDANFILKLENLQKSVYLGEKFEIVLTFKQKQNTSVVDSDFVPPNFENFWIKNESKPQKYNEGEYSVTKIVYQLSPKKTGILTIPKALIKIASKSNQELAQGFFIPNVNWKHYYSNDLEIDVKEPPYNTYLIGDFTIKAMSDKTQTNANEAINLTIEVNGDGNLEDIKRFEPKIEGVSIYGEKTSINGTKLIQNIAFVSDKDFTIPPFSLKFFSPLANEIKEISTEAIDIKIKNSSTQAINIKKESIEPQIKSDLNITILLPIITFFVGLLGGIFGVMYRDRFIFKKAKKSSIKEPKVLLAKLLPYRDDEDVKGIIEILEKNIYQNQNIYIDKKALNDILKKYNI